jgi:hypothetical protein
MLRRPPLRRCARAILACIAAFCLDAAPATAQDLGGEPEPTNVRARIGPLMLNPTIALTNAGVDDNVFNDPASAAPKRDFTLTLTPSTELWLRAGPTWVTGTIKEDINWYQQYSSERSANTTYNLGWRVPLSRVLLRMSTTFSDSRERPGFEIDARADRRQLGYSGTAEYRALSRTFIGVAASRDRVRFADEATFFGTNLHDELNRVSTSYSLTVREQLTALTAITFAASDARDRFDLAHDRDSKSNSVSAGLAFDRAALISGSASIGYTKFSVDDRSVPAYAGLTTLVNLSYTALESTRIALSANRSVQYSFDVAQPYYLLTGYTASVAQQIFGPVDVVARIGHQSLAYRDRAGAQIAAPNRTDEVVTYGGGVGYHLGNSLRLGVNIDRSERSSPVENRTYRGLRYGTALTYGI